jgi:hypothetical protein
MRSFASAFLRVAAVVLVVLAAAFIASAIGA